MLPIFETHRHAACGSYQTCAYDTLLTPTYAQRRNTNAWDKESLPKSGSANAEEGKKDNTLIGQ
ncbi:hypothetical protein CMQ_4498 [Grosmannia clavigera kw1407]|uniref:Uncharacterized protein n=1 Tax=Grosmannia clavigera (strain kw1407 / UAMH 11150) TaxID=655863 RepID=F0XTT8_GROCL|nr:uncharacterized protein CMQ_4498 [Grosmannia clavigera kw1407]EFW98646.1 hypothetical protein CMQ_4498 [Grosmannia clavigera kw1407]